MALEFRLKGSELLSFIVLLCYPPGGVGVHKVVSSKGFKMDDSRNLLRLMIVRCGLAFFNHRLDVKEILGLRPIISFYLQCRI